MDAPTVPCAHYRDGRRLLALKLQLEQDKDLDPRRRAEIEAEVASLEREMGLD